MERKMARKGNQENLGFAMAIPHSTALKPAMPIFIKDKGMKSIPINMPKIELMIPYKAETLELMKRPMANKTPVTILSWNMTWPSPSEAADTGCSVLASESEWSTFGRRWVVEIRRIKSQVVKTNGKVYGVSLRETIACMT